MVIQVTLESGMDVGQGINGGSGKFYKKISTGFGKFVQRFE